MSLNNSNKNHGFVKRHPDGYAFFISKNDSQSDVYISAEDLNGAMSNDIVEVSIFGRAGGDRPRGRVEKILERHFTTIVGRLDARGDHFVLKDLSYAWGENLVIPKVDPNLAKPGELILAKIVSYPGTKEGFIGEVTSSLGQPSDPAIDVKRIAMTQGLPMEFEKKSLSEVEKYGLEIPSYEIKKRKDLRDLALITIDGETAKDFDDAVFVERKGKNFRLVVAIADVSFYVKPGMNVDKEAYDRGTSTYFPNYVIPMLPEGLSNELCSLKPNVDRLAMVADMVIDQVGKFISYEFYEAVIKSHGRLTYGKVQALIDGSKVPEFEHLRDNIMLSKSLAEILMKKRFAEGSLDLDIPEVLVEVDEEGQAVDIHLSDRIFAHRLIEEFMLKANIAVAEFIDKKDKPQIYRVHGEPDVLALDTFMRFFNQFTNFKYQSPDPSEICRVLSTIEGKEKNILQTLFLRSMRQAKYSPEEIGHFGLAFSHYAHFTSPIRRYPDLITHRVLKSIVSGTGAVNYQESDLEDMADILSQLEQRSVKAERKVKSIKKARFAEKLLGQDFEGSITSVARFGVFITLDQYPIEGMIRIGDLGSDYYVYDEEQLCLLGQKSGKRFKLGDRVRVTVAQVNTEDGFIDLTLEEHQGKVQSKEASSWSHGKNGGHKKSKFKNKKSKGSHRDGSQRNQNSEGGGNRNNKKKKKFSKGGSNNNPKDQDSSNKENKPKFSGEKKVKAADLFTSSHRRVGFGKKK